MNVINLMAKLEHKEDRVLFRLLTDKGYVLLELDEILQDDLRPVTCLYFSRKEEY